MYFSDQQKEARHQTLRKHMKEQGVDVVMVRGSSATRGEGSNFRYLADFPNINIPLVLFFFRDRKERSMMLVESPFQTEKAKRYSWAEDVRRSTNFLQSVLDFIKEKGLQKMKVAIDGFDKIPHLWVQEIQKSYPRLRFVDFSPVFKKMRMVKTDEEIRMVKKSAALLDLAFHEGLQYIRPGNTEWEVISQMDLRLKRYGVEKTFNIISLGPDAVGYPPSGKKIGKKGMVFIELTGTYGGYWAQLARVVSLGKPDKALVRLHQTALQARDATLKYLKPGFKVSEAISKMEEKIRESGMDLKPIYGHICGLDLIEDRPNPQNETPILPNMVFIIHPAPVLGRSSVAWGETYLITKNGNQRLNKVSDELMVL
jgi:Xaa-Pro dipeptidase